MRPFLNWQTQEIFPPTPSKRPAKLRPDLVRKGSDVSGFQHFCQEFTDLSFREAHTMYVKNQFWNIRTGITTYTDEKEWLNPED